MKKYFVITIFLISFSSSVYSECETYIGNTASRRTDGGITSFKYDPTFSASKKASIAAAASAWTTANCCVNFYFNEFTTYEIISETDLGYDAFGNFDLARTYIQLSTSGEILYSPTTINNNLFINWYTGSSSTVPSGSYDLQSVMMHEFGHWVDLGEQYTETGN